MRGRPKGSFKKPKQVLTFQEQEIQDLLTQKRNLPSGSQERIALGRKIKVMQGRARQDRLNPSIVEFPSTKLSENKASIALPDTIDNNCPLKDICLKENKKYLNTLTCFDTVYLLNNGCNFYKEMKK